MSHRFLRVYAKVSCLDLGFAELEGIDYCGVEEEFRHTLLKIYGFGIGVEGEDEH